ncbi:MAG: GNAT family N-acetyltransferase, partial [Acidimicrobiales bacterium]
LFVRQFDRTLVAVDGDEVVGTSLAYGFRLSVPGRAREIATAGFSGLSVLPTHRRVGILRELMRRNLDDAHRRGEVLSVLWPSESGIYRRFGYGVGTTTLSWEIERTRATLIDGLDSGGRTVRFLPNDPAKVAELIAPVHDAVRQDRPGMLGRDATWWAYRTASAATGNCWIGVDGPDGLEGYATYSVSGSWESDGPANEVSLGEFASTTTEAEIALWRYLLDIDLVRRITTWGRPPDETLPYLLRDPRRLQRRAYDGLWVRTVDLAACLAGRAYAGPLDIVLEVTDGFCQWNEGRWHLSTDGASATCTRSMAEPDLSLDVGEVGSAFLGGQSLRTLARAGLVHERTEGALQAADLAFAWSPAPWAITWF